MRHAASIRLRTFGCALLTAGAILSLAQTPANKPGAQGAKPAATAWPDPLITYAGRPVTSASEFVATRRLELLQDFEENVYGHTPKQSLPEEMQVTSVDEHALSGAAIRKQIVITIGSTAVNRKLHLLLYLPSGHKGPVPVFLGLNFNGNTTVTTDPGVDRNEVWIPDPEEASIPLAKELEGHIRRKPAESSRGTDASQWPIAEILQSGYGLATMYAGDIEPDFAAGIGYGVRPLFFKPGQSLPAADDWGAIGAWAWGMSRAADYLISDPAIDPHSIIAIGHSRFGKAALWAGAQDERFAMVISNESGQGGAALSHREAAESISHLNIAFPYWFCPNYHHFTDRTSELPVDGHLLLALIAPRPVFVASAHDDPYSDPEGEFLSAKAASNVYRLFGKDGLPTDATYEVDRPEGRTLHYYLRPGGHDILPSDWQRYIQFADENLQSKTR
jgi:(4-O-methyl)-D-glucuronate---lignin esterase